MAIYLSTRGWNGESARVDPCTTLRRRCGIFRIRVGGEKKQILGERGEERRERESLGKEPESEALQDFPTLCAAVYICTRAQTLCTLVESEHGCGPRDREGAAGEEKQSIKKRTKETTVDAEEVVERARIPGKHGKVGN